MRVDLKTILIVIGMVAGSIAYVHAQFQTKDEAHTDHEMLIRMDNRIYKLAVKQKVVDPDEESK